MTRILFRYRKIPQLNLVLLLTLFFTSCGINSIYIRDDVKNLETPKLDRNKIANSIFLLGDAGKPTLDSKEPVFALLEREASYNNENNLIIFLGDNVDPNGLVDEGHPDRKIQEKYLLEEINVIKNSGAKGIFIPGNHDWQQGKEKGLEYLTNQIEFIESMNLTNLRFLPENGCPGPEVFYLNKNIKIIVIDTQWWLQKNKSFKKISERSETFTEEQIINNLRKELNTPDSVKTIVTGHHPFETHGMHGGFFNWKDHLFPLTRLYSWMWLPLPVVGSAFPLLRNSVQDVSSNEYKNMIKKIEAVFNEYPPLVYASGHDHALQVIERKNYLQLVSGKGKTIEGSVVEAGKNTLFAREENGFMRIDFLKDGRVRLTVIEVTENNKQGKEIYSMWIDNNL